MGERHSTWRPMTTWHWLAPLRLRYKGKWFCMGHGFVWDMVLYGTWFCVGHLVLHRDILFCMGHGICGILYTHTTSTHDICSPPPPTPTHNNPPHPTPTPNTTQAACAATIDKYGVGACGPRGFYGTIDVHLDLEARLSQFLSTQGTILYSYDLATIPSVIPAFANRNDLIICDEAVNYSIQKGCNLSRAKVLYFKHNDMGDLERVLKGVVDEDKKHKYACGGGC